MNQTRKQRKSAKAARARRLAGPAWVVYADYEYPTIATLAGALERVTRTKRVFLARQLFKGTARFASPPEIPAPPVWMEETGPSEPFYWSLNQEFAMEFGNQEDAIALVLLCEPVSDASYNLLRIR